MDNLSNRDIYEINGRYPWNGSIRTDNVDKYSSKAVKLTYKLYATGDADATNGRKYVALPTNTKITPKIVSKYNLF